jgi:hypothetical protein
MKNTLMVKDHEKDSLIDADDKKEMVCGTVNNFLGNL